MPARELIFYQGGFYHVYSRGNEKRNIFLDSTDRRRFLNKLRFYSEKYLISILAYCVMPNHYHLLVKQKSDKSVSEFMQRVNLAYSMYFNRRYERVGSLFQGRFKAKMIQNDEYLLHLSRYIHLNPKEFLSRKLKLPTYIWSSYPTYVGVRKDDTVTDVEFVLRHFSKRNPFADYKQFVEVEQSVPEGVSEILLDS